MKVFESALLLVVGTILIAFSAISFGLFPRPLSLNNPTLLVELIGISGVIVFGLGARGLHRIHRTISGGGGSAPPRNLTA